MSPPASPSLPPDRPVPRPSPPHKSGLTAIELLVVLSIVALLATLILPAVMRSREVARETVCQNRLRQLTLALLQAEQRDGHFPVVGDLAAGPFTALLPGLEQETVAGAISRGDLAEVKTPDVFYCPQDAMEEHPLFRATSYGFNTGSGGLEAGDLGPFALDPLSPQRVRDGRATTAAFAEIASPTPANRLVWRLDLNPFAATSAASAEACLAFDEEGGESVPGIARGSNWPIGDPMETGYNHLLTPGTRSCALTIPGAPGVRTDYNASLNAASGHPGFVNLALLDGAVRPISRDVDPAVWRGLGSIAGGEVIGDDFSAADE